MQYLPEDLRFDPEITPAMIFRTLLPKARLAEASISRRASSWTSGKALWPPLHRQPPQDQSDHRRVLRETDTGNILLLDEPFSGLDAFARQVFRGNLARVVIQCAASRELPPGLRFHGNAQRGDDRRPQCPPPRRQRPNLEPTEKSSQLTRHETVPPHISHDFPAQGLGDLRFCGDRLPFVLPLISSATEKPLLVQPARILAAWNTLWICALVWGLFTAAREGENNAKIRHRRIFPDHRSLPTRQLFEIWLAVFCFIAPLTLITALICQFAAAPADPVERSMWWVLNAQYAALFLLVIAPLLALATALASRFGGITGFSVTLLITLYGLYGVGYLDNMLKLEANPILRELWMFSPHYRFADLTQRLYFKTGALPRDAFWTMTLYFAGILAVYTGVSRLCFRTKLSA
jgi:hypothetical protein